MPGGKHGVNRDESGPAAVDAKLRCVSERVCPRREDSHNIASLHPHGREAGVNVRGAFV